MWLLRIDLVRRITSMQDKMALLLNNTIIPASFANGSYRYLYQMFYFSVQHKGFMLEKYQMIYGSAMIMIRRNPLVLQFTVHLMGLFAHFLAGQSIISKTLFMMVRLYLTIYFTWNAYGLDRLNLFKANKTKSQRVKLS